MRGRAEAARALPVLVTVEALTAFSLYGLLSVLVLYLLDVLNPASGSLISGLGDLHALQSLLGGTSPSALASQTFGWFAGLICFTPIVGGLVADRFLGYRKTISSGLALLGVGYALLALSSLLLLGLSILIIASGLVLTNIKAQIGTLYPKTAPARSSNGFGLDLIATNLGAFGGPLVCGFVSQSFGWDAAFIAASLSSFAALIVYLSKWRGLPDKGADPVPVDEDRKTPERAALLDVLFVIGINIVYFATYNQTFNAFALWASQRVDRELFGITVPVPAIIAFDGLFAIVATGCALAWWARKERLGRSVGNRAKLLTGFASLTCAFLSLAAAEVLSGGSRGISPVACLVFFAFTALAAPFIWTATLSVISRNAPHHLAGTMMGLFAVSAFAGNVLAGWIGQFYEPLGPLYFWSLNAALAGAGILVLLVSRLYLGTRAHPLFSPSRSQTPTRR